MGFLLGVDVGGTNLRAILASRGGRVEARARRRTPAREGWPAVAAAISEVARSVAGGRRLTAVGVGVPASVDAVRGIVAGRCKIAGEAGYPLARVLSGRLGGVPVAIENDANAAAFGEFRFGAGRGCRHLIALTLGTGVGGGIILDGSLHRGAGGSAGEAGHVPVDPRGRRCPCGRRGCLEAYAGARGLLRTAGGIAATPADLARLARGGDRRALAAFARLGVSLGVAIASFANLLDPERVVLAGGIARSFSLFAGPMREAFAERALGGPRRRLRIVRGRLGDDAGALGAAALAAAIPS